MPVPAWDSSGAVEPPLDVMQRWKAHPLGVDDASMARQGRTGTVLANAGHLSNENAAHVSTLRPAARGRRPSRCQVRAGPGPQGRARCRNPLRACRRRHHGRRRLAYRCCRVLAGTVPATPASCDSSIPRPPAMRLGQTPVKKFALSSTICRQSVVQMSNRRRRQKRGTPWSRPARTNEPGLRPRCRSPSGRGPGNAK